MGIMAGDNRGFAKDSSSGTFRAQAVVNFANPSASHVSLGMSHYANGSVAGKPVDHGSYVHVHGNVALVHIDAGVGGPMGLGGHAPSVKADFTVTENSNGSVTMTGVHTQFPSFEAYSYGGGGLNFQYTESPKNQFGPAALSNGENTSVPH